MEILPSFLKNGVKRKVVKQVQDEIASFFPVTEEETIEEKAITQLAKIRYFPKNEAMGFPRAQYEGLRLFPKTNKKGQNQIIVPRLSTKWMQENFDTKFLKFVVLASHRSASYGKWISIPAGASEEDGEKAPTEMITSIQVTFPQNGYDTCVFKSVASALTYLKIHKLAYFFSSVARKYTATPVDQQLTYLTVAALEREPRTFITKWMTRKRAMSLDLMKHTHRKQSALVVVPLGADGGIGHAITITGNYIFDTTLKHALKLDKKSLDWCCSNDGGYERVYLAVELAFKKEVTFKNKARAARTKKELATTQFNSSIT